MAPAALRGLIASLLAVAALALGADAASAYVYWGARLTVFDGFLARAGLDGTGIQREFAGDPAPTDPVSFAATDTHIYWADRSRDAIGRAKLDGTDRNANFITDVPFPSGVAVDGGHVYWSSEVQSPIGRANLDGSGRNDTFVATGEGQFDSPVEIAVDAGHIYWAANERIGRANINGTSPNKSFISGLSSVFDVEVDGSHLYFAQSGGIGRANLDGTVVDPTFITGMNQVKTFDIDSTYVYVTGFTEDDGIDRIGLNGTGKNTNFIAGRADGVTQANGRLYWGANGRIGRADADGTDVEPKFILNRAIFATDMAIGGDYVYFLDENKPWIGRAKRDGSVIDPEFIALDNSESGFVASDIAVDGDHIYWTQYVASQAVGAVGRADLDGSDPDPGFIDLGADTVGSVAIHGSHIYWGESSSSSLTAPLGKSIGRADLNGANPERPFIAGAGIEDLAVNDDHIYWTPGDGPFGRANVDGTDPDPDFLDPPHHAAGIQSIAIDSSHLYWTNPAGNPTAKIGRANLDGSAINERLVDPEYGLSANDYGFGLAVDSLGPAPGFTLNVSRQGSGNVTAPPDIFVRSPFDPADPNPAHTYAAGTEVNVTATPDDDWLFDHWTGACSGTAACQVTMNGDRVVGAVFVQFPDQDGDGVRSHDNCMTVSNPSQADLDSDRKGDACDPDRDNDGASNGVEAQRGLRSFDRDSDDDGLSDGREINQAKTKPAKFDSDGDGLSDGLELGLVRGVPNPAGGPLGTKPASFKRDFDPRTKTSPLKKDTDGDGLSDGAEDKNHNGRRDKGETDPLKKDTDGDGLNDRVDRNPLVPPSASGGGGGVPATGPEIVRAVPSGVVRVRQPLEHRFHRLDKTKLVDVGSIFDASDGHVRIDFMQGVAGGSTAARIGGGRFKLEHVRYRKQAYLVMMGGEVRSCGGAKLRARKLSVSGDGPWRTIGRYAYATASGPHTAWVVYDRCDGTTVVARRGDVEVRDRVARKTVTVAEGHRYLARRPGAGR